MAAYLAHESASEGVLAETTGLIVQIDFPERCPTLLQDVDDFLLSRNAARVQAALLTLRQLFKCYELKSRDTDKTLATDDIDAGLEHRRQLLESI